MSFECVKNLDAVETKFRNELKNISDIEALDSYMFYKERCLIRFLDNKFNIVDCGGNLLIKYNKSINKTAELLYKDMMKAFLGKNNVCNSVKKAGIENTNREFEDLIILGNELGAINSDTANRYKSEFKTIISKMPA